MTSLEIGPTTFAAFATTADTVAATRSKLAKVEALAMWFRQLDPARLSLAARYLGGRVFPVWDGRTLSVGGAAISRTVAALTGASDEQMSAAWRRHADPGAVMAELYPLSGVELGGVDLLEVDTVLSAVADTRSADRRIEHLLELLKRCTSDEARYVIKLVSGDMRIGLREGLVEEAIVSTFNVEPAAVARANMVLGDLGETAALAAAGDLSNAAPRLFVPLRFMLANAVADPDEIIKRLGQDVWVEDKYDGIRCQLHHDKGRVALYSRDLRDITRQFPEVAAAALAGLPDGAIFDGELIGWKDGRVLPFGSLQTRLGRLAPSAAVQESVPVVYVMWDQLVAERTSCLDFPLRERRAMLEALHLGDVFALAHVDKAHDSADLDRLFSEARARLNEGLLVKNPDSPYLPGRRGLHWLKLKRPLDTLDVVVVGAQWGYGKRHGVLSDVTFAVRAHSGDFVTVGKAYTGLTDTEIAQMTALLQELTISVHGSYHAVTPQLVLEIAFDTVQASARHKSGYALRFPRIVTWRHDKGVADVDSVTKVAQLAEARVSAFSQRIEQ